MKQTTFLNLLFFAWFFGSIGLGMWMGKGGDGMDTPGDWVQVIGGVSGVVIYILVWIWKKF